MGAKSSYDLDLYVVARVDEGRRRLRGTDELNQESEDQNSAVHIGQVYRFSTVLLGCLTGALEADGEPVGAEDVQSSAGLPRFVTGTRKATNLGEELDKGDSRLETRQRRADAEVNAVAEGEMRIGRASNVKAVRVGELDGIAVCGANHGQHPFARWNHVFSKLDLLSRGPEHELQRLTVAQHFFDR